MCHIYGTVSSLPKRYLLPFGKISSTLSPAPLLPYSPIPLFNRDPFLRVINIRPYLPYGYPLDHEGNFVVEPVTGGAGRQVGRHPH